MTAAAPAPAPTLAAVEAITDGARAAALVQHPVRRRILALARTPMSATEMAGRLGMPRQRVNYHVRQLERSRFLRRAERRLRRNMMEQQYVATAATYVIGPEVLGPLAPHLREVQDAMSAAAMFAITSRAQADLTRAVADAAAEGKRISTLSFTADIRFTSAEQRAAFAEALQRAITDVIARHSAPFVGTDGTPAGGRPFRLFAGCHPIPRDDRPDDLAAGNDAPPAP